MARYIRYQEWVQEVIRSTYDVAFLTALVARLGLGRGCAIPRLKGKEPSATHLFDYLFNMSETYDMTFTTALNATSQRRELGTRPDRSLTVVAMNTAHINTDTTYTTLHHVPGWRASFGAVGSLVADCHDSTEEHTRRSRSSREGRHYEEEAE